ncbi:glycosyltransferase [Agarilytica rhodophyticola]|uniref:glycosyltransferase n=1 Tax=Agarilytica rhodophyticola TaxID=1737490 RepID=UPI000B3434C9|nr:glycosyltransferase [Agarilytica rhodophyticola]
MRIAYFTNTYPRATDTFIRREVIGLRKRGFDVVTYSVRKTGSDHDVDEEVITEKRNTKYILPFNILALLILNFKTLIADPKNYLRTFILAYKTVRPGIKGHFLQLVYFLEAVSLSKLLIEDRVEHLHNHLGDNSGTVTLLAAKLADIPYSISIHGPHIFFDGLHWALDKKTEHAKFISCIGHFCTSQMMLYSDKEYWSKFKIIRCGVDLNRFDYQEPKGIAKKMVYVGRLSAEKGVPILFDSIAKLKEQNYDVQLTLLGDGEDRDFLEKLAHDMNINDHVIFGGFVDQKTIATTLRESDIFVLPSFAEGIPVALMEAMAIGIPVIATYVGGVTELVIDQNTGQVVSASDSEGLAQAIARYIDQPEWCKTISKNAREKVATEFNIEDQVDKLAQLFSTEKN